MKKLIKASLLTIFMIFMTSTGMAQGTSVGIKGGVTLYQGVIEIMGVEETDEPSFSYGGGLFIEMSMNRFISLQPEVLILMKASEESNYDTIATFTYIDVPLLLRLNLSVLDGFTPYVLGGPYVGYLLKSEIEQAGNKEDMTDAYEPINFGAKMGGGLKLGALTIEVMYDMGLMNILDIDVEGYSAKHNGLTMMLGISF